MSRIDIERDILGKVSEIKKKSEIYQAYMKTTSYKAVDEIGGHIDYFEKVSYQSICPSMKFVDELLVRCALELGVQDDIR